MQYKRAMQCAIKTFRDSYDTKDGTSNLTCYKSSQINCDIKEQPFQCSVLLKQVDLKKWHPTNHSEHAH